MAKSGSPELTPDEQRAEALKRRGREEEIGQTREGLTEFLCKQFSITKAQAGFLLADEFERPFQRQPKFGANGTIIRENKEGEIRDLTSEEYWRKRHNDKLPKPKVNEGEVALALAADAIGNLSMQSQLIKEYGVEHTASILKLAGGKLGEIVTKPKPGQGDKSKTVDSGNPWANNAPGAEQARIDVIRRLGTKAASGMAKAAGVDLAGRKLNVAKA
jgi:hypothetical protein